MCIAEKGKRGVKIRCCWYRWLDLRWTVNAVVLNSKKSKWIAKCRCLNVTSQFFSSFLLEGCSRGFSVFFVCACFENVLIGRLIILEYCSPCVLCVRALLTVRSSTPLAAVPRVQCSRRFIPSWTRVPFDGTFVFSSHLIIRFIRDGIAIISSVVY